MKSKKTEVGLKDISTRELMNALNVYHRVRYWREYSDFDTASESVYVATRLVAGGQPIAVWATYEEIRKELATRPHIPSKREARAIRRQAAKAGR